MMNGPHEYFTDHYVGPIAPTQYEINESTWIGLKGLVDRSISRGDFGNTFPEGCPDLPSTCCGTDLQAFNGTLQAEVPAWPGWGAVPDVATACDFLEFCHRYVALASSCKYHDFFGHDHLQFDVAAGKGKFRDNVNLLLRRNGIALRMRDDGLMERTLDDPTGEEIRRAVFQTGDSGLNRLLEAARSKFMNPSPPMRQEALERAWDAWERLKTIKDADKQLGIKMALDACAIEPTIRDMLEEEARTLTNLGNRLRIRHFETDKTEVAEAENADYLFQRMFSMLLLILRKNEMLA